MMIQKFYIRRVGTTPPPFKNITTTPIVRTILSAFHNGFPPKMAVPTPTATILLNKYVPDICAASVFFDNVPFYVLACIYVVLGFLFICFGYRFFKCAMFSTGFTMASIIVYVLCSQNGYFLPLINYIISASAGVLFGFITMYIQYVGLFVTGLKNGLYLGAAGIMIYNYAYIKDNPTTYWQIILTEFLSGIVGACSNMYFKKGLTIIGTCVYGSAYFLMGLDFIIYGGATIKWVFERSKLVPVVAPPCTHSWILLVGWPTSIILGTIMQWTVNGNKIQHEETLAAQKRRSKASQPHLTREQRAEMRQRKYRYLYQVRTAHGDVISQSYVQALQQKSSESWQPGGECSTLQSDSTHLTVLAPDTSHPDSEEDGNQRPCH